MQSDVVGVPGKVLLRSAMLILHIFRQEGEPMLDRANARLAYPRQPVRAREQMTTVWGDQPAIINGSMVGRTMVLRRRQRGYGLLVRCASEVLG